MAHTGTPKLADTEEVLLQKMLAALGGTPFLGATAQETLYNLTTLVAGASGSGGSASPLSINGGTVTSDTPALTVAQTWNSGGTAFNLVNLNVTNTASAATSSFITANKDGVSRFNVRQNGTVTVHRQEADTSGTTLQLSKRGTTGDATAAIASGSGVGSLDFMGWNGSAASTVATFRVFALETFTGSALATQFTFGVASVGSTTITTRAALSAVSFNLTTGCEYYLNGARMLNPLSVYASGTVYTLTATSAGVDFGTTDPILTINAAGTYAIRAKVKIALNGATFAANRTLTIKLRRTNNTAADVSNSSTTYVVPITTTITNTLAVIELPEVLYTTANTNDTVQIFADISVLPTAGTISVDEASAVAVRLY